MEFLAFKGIAGPLLSELFKDEQIAVTTAGALRDSATVAATTFVGGLLSGPLGAVVGAAAGTGILGVSKLLGYGHYKSLREVLQEDFSEQEKNSFYEKLWEKLKTSFTNQNLVLTALDKLVSAIQQNPEVMQNIRNELIEWLTTKNMHFN